MKPRMFIASSSERLDLAYAVQEAMERDVEATVWTQGVFAPSRTSMASLIDILDESDFGLFILAPDDVTAIRNREHQTVRDNVIFELGLFIGRLGSDRCFLVVPRDMDDLHLPTDLLGLTPATFDPDRQDTNMVAALGPACNRIRKSIEKLGRCTPAGQPQVAEKENTQTTSYIEDQNDCIAVIQSWMGARSMADNRRAINYDVIDRELNLAPGSSRKYIEQAAARFGYVVDRKGKDFILFKDEDPRY